MIKVAIYARVSSERQEREKTIESQIAGLKRICKENNAKIVNEYIDNGYSGESLARPALDKLRDDAGKGFWNTLYVYSADRLGRDHIDQGLVLRELKKKNIKVIFRDRPLTEENKLLTDIESLLAEHEKRQFLERTRRGKLHKAKEGIVNYIPKLGLKYIPKFQDPQGKGFYEIDEKEAKIVKLIFDLYIKHQSTGKVSQELDEKGIRTRRGRVWTPSRVRVLLQERTYKGEAYFNRTRRVESKIKRKDYTRTTRTSTELKDRTEWIPVKFPAIVDKEKFDFVQTLLARTHRDFNKHKVPYLLSGILKCDECGTRMVGEAHYKGDYLYRRYRCADRARKYPVKNYCKALSIKIEEIEPIVLDIVKMAISDPDFIDRVKYHYEKKHKNKNLLLEEKQELIKERETIKEKEKSIYDICEELKKRNINREELFKRLEEYDKRKKEIINDLKEIEARVNQSDKKVELLENIKKQGKLISKGFDKLSFDEKKNFLRLILRKLTYNSDIRQINIEGIVPLEPAKLEEYLVGKKEYAPVRF